MTSTVRRIGVLGGAFDPPHVAHVALGRAAVEQLQLDSLLVLPTGRAWHKTRDLTGSEHRLAMARLAFAELSVALVDDRETRRAGPTYTVDTLRELQAEHPQAELFLILGKDQGDVLSSWHKWELIPQFAIICVADRADQGEVKDRFVPPASLRERFRSLQMPRMPVSATDIRSRISKHQDHALLVSEPVARYIDQHHLYPSA